MVIVDYGIGSLEVVIPFGNSMIYSVGFLFWGAPLPCVSVKVRDKNVIGNLVPSYSCDNCA